MNMLEKYQGIIFSVAVFLLGGALVWLFFSYERVKISESLDRVCAEKYPWINPDIDCQATDKMSDQIEAFRKAVQKVVEDAEATQHIKRAAVFYRDLDTKRWFGIDHHEEYYPGSLVKLPLAMGFYKMAELRPDVLRQKITIPKTDTVEGNTDQHYQPQDPLQPDVSYTVEEMIRHMLVYSDNAPFGSLMNFGAAFIEKAFNDLGVRQIRLEDKVTGWTSSVSTYAGALRSLYNTSYLQSESSNFILDLLTQSTFREGIVAGVPEGVKVAHKFGEGTGTDEQGGVLSYTLNDCGIVYKPAHPFILCIMTEGNDFSQMERVIQNITKIVYSGSE